MKTIKDLAEISGRSKTAIRKTAAKLGILETAQRSESGTVLFTEDQAAQILQKIQDGATPSGIGDPGTGEPAEESARPSDQSGPETAEDPSQDQTNDQDSDQDIDQDTDRSGPAAETLDAYRERIRAQDEEIKFLRSLVVSLQNEKQNLLQLAAPAERKPETTDAETVTETRSAPEPQQTPQEPPETRRKGLLWRIFHPGE